VRLQRLVARQAGGGARPRALRQARRAVVRGADARAPCLP
jgi:hypothetical protein